MQHNTSLLKEKWLTINKSFNKTLLLMMLAIAALMLSACHSSNSPEQVVTDFYKAMEKNDTDAAIKLIYIPKTKDEHAEIVKGKLPMLFEASAEEIHQHKGIKKLKIEKVQYTEDKKRAKISFSVEYNDGEISRTSEMKTINDGGKWLINF